MRGHATLGRLLLVFGVILTVHATAAPGRQQPGQPPRRHDNAVTHWNTISTTLLLDPGPILEGRAFAIVHAAMYDAVNGVERRYEPYAADVSFPGASLDAAVATAAHDVMMAFATDQREKIEEAYAAALAEVPDGPAKDQGVTLGRLCAKANLDRRADDGIAKANEPAYVPTGQPGDYDFTPPFDAPPLGPVAFFPGLGEVTPFAVAPKQQRVRGPDPLTSDEYTQDFNLLKSIGSLTSSIRTPDQTEIAFFWYEEPNFKWNRIANALIRQHHIDAWGAARVFALVNFAINDAGIACMAAKYQFRFWRPYTAIRRAGEDGNPGTEADPEWKPLFFEAPFLIPPIPEYPSAMASLSAAAAEVLVRDFGDKQRLEVTSTTLPDVTRRFESLTKAAKEAGMSRVYGGIHFLHAVEDGFQQGRGIGRAVSRQLKAVHP
jgi:hypothetical protein